MNKVLDLGSNEVIDLCANEDCGDEIHFGQACYKIGHELVCSGGCLVKRLRAKTMIAGKEGSHGN